MLAGMSCPECYSEGPFNIVARATFLNVTDDGAAEFENMDWEGESFCQCCECGKQGVVSDFSTFETGEPRTNTVSKDEILTMQNATTSLNKARDVIVRDNQLKQRSKDHE